MAQKLKKLIKLKVNCGAEMCTPTNKAIKDSRLPRYVRRGLRMGTSSAGGNAERGGAQKGAELKC